MSEQSDRITRGVYNIIDCSGKKLAIPTSSRVKLSSLELTNEEEQELRDGGAVLDDGFINLSVLKATLGIYGFEKGTQGRHI